MWFCARNLFPQSRRSEMIRQSLLKQLYFPVTRFSLMPHMMAERRSIAPNSDFAVAVIRAAVVRITRTQLRDRRGRWLLSSATSRYVHFWQHAPHIPASFFLGRSMSARSQRQRL
jgi:hypothetical protein